MNSAELKMFRDLIEVATLSTLLTEKDARKAAVIISGHVADILDTADKEIQKKIKHMSAQIEGLKADVRQAERAYDRLKSAQDRVNTTPEGALEALRAHFASK